MNIARALERRIKKEILSQPQSARVVAPAGWGDVLHQQILSVSQSWLSTGKFTPSVTTGTGEVRLSNIDVRQVIELPLRLSTASDIYFLLRERHIGSFGELAQFYSQIPWELYVNPGAVVTCKVQSFRSKLFHESKLRDMLRASLSAGGFLTDVDPASSPKPLRLLAIQSENRHAVYLAMSRSPIYHRHYKPSLHHAAPLHEAIASACLHWFFSHELNRDWSFDLLYVPFAGSGTFLAETLIARGFLPPMNWHVRSDLYELPFFPRATWDYLQKQWGQVFYDLGGTFDVLMVERDIEQFAALEQNVATILGGGRCKVQNLSIDLKQTDAFEVSLPSAKKNIFMPLNPPYGLRLEQDHDRLGANRYYQKLAFWLRSMAGTGVQLRGLLLVPEGVSLGLVKESLGHSGRYDVHGFTQGGQHIRCLLFAL